VTTINDDAVTEPVDLSRLTEAEKTVVAGVADYYWQNDGMPKDRGSVIGYLIVCDPAEQSFAQICDTLSVGREAVERVCDQLVPANVIIRKADPAIGDDTVYLSADSWPNAVKHVFANIPEFHEILTDGIEVLADAAPERRERIERVERLFGYLSAEIPSVLDNYAKQDGYTSQEYYKPENAAERS
jgi:hypothetical protein